MNAGLIPFSVTEFALLGKGMVPNTICPFVVGEAEQVDVVPQYCICGCLLTTRVGTGTVLSTENGAWPLSVVTVDAIGTLNVLVVALRTSSGVLKFAALPM
jgi:hypothetical protein